MLTVYVFCAVIGGGLIVLSLFGGDHDHGGDFGHDIGHDVGHDVGHDAGSDHDAGHIEGPWLLFFSLRFWTYLIAVFGVLGLLLTLFTDSKEPLNAIVSGVSGFASGLVASFAVRWLRSHEADSTTREKDLLGVRARVTVPLRDGQLGRVRVTVKGELIDLMATAEEPLALPEGSEVVIVGMENGRATVMPLDTLLQENA